MREESDGERLFLFLPHCAGEIVIYFADQNSYELQLRTMQMVMNRCRVTLAKNEKTYESS